MQGQFRAWKEDDVQRKQRNAFRPHGSQPKSYQRGGPLVIVLGKKFVTVFTHME